MLNTVREVFVESRLLSSLRVVDRARLGIMYNSASWGPVEGDFETKTETCESVLHAKISTLCYCT